MSLSPTLPTSGALSAGVPAQCVGDCHSCRFVTNYAYPVFGRMKGMIIGWDAHCGFFDRRVMVIKGCTKFSPVVGIEQPHPLEH